MLQEREGGRADELAQALGVSLRTVRRDLAELRAEGVDVDASAGRGGGVRLGARAPRALSLSLPEVVSLWLAAQVSHGAAALPWSSVAQRAVRQLLAALPPARARHLRALGQRIITGPPPTPSMLRDYTGTGDAARSLLPVLEEAMFAGTALRFTYRDRGGRLSTRHVEPHGLLVQAPLWYLLGKDVGADAPRMFRMDRIARPTRSAHTFAPDEAVVWALLPDGFAWQALGGGSRS